MPKTATRSTHRPAYRLVRTPPRITAAPVLDPAQQGVVDAVRRPGHGPLLVLAGPGTGKTTTLVEAVVARVEAGADPDRILTLTFSRKAAAELRDRISARLGRAVVAQSAWTFHAFAYALAGEAQAPEDLGRPLRLLSGPEQDVMVRDLLAGELEDRTVRWPDDLEVALPTRGFADEVRALLARARGLGLEPEQLAALAGPVRPDWAGAAQLFDEYLHVLDAMGALDYGELIHRAVLLAESVEGGAMLRGRYDLVVVDEYQDTDPAQERLLAAIAGGGRDLVAVGDPDQSIYAFRGAEVRGLLDFCVRFLRADGGPAGVRTLQVSRRAGAALLGASRAVAARMPLAGAGLADHLRAHRALAPAEGLAEGSVEVLTFPTVGAQLETVADLLRREHLDAGTPWSQMAVLVRSGVRSVPAVRRVLGAAGVPVEVAGDELPLAREPAVAPLLLALRVVLDPDELTAQTARALLLSPLGGADAHGLRRLGRALRDAERTAGADAALPRPSAELLREAVAQPEVLALLDDQDAGPARRLGRLLGHVRELADDRATSAYDVLWALWQGTPWPQRLERASAAGGAGGQAADRDLDAVVALFDLAARDDERSERRGTRGFLAELEAQQIPADTLAERGRRADAVRLLTAHRSKGLEWDVVVVADVQAEDWPDLRTRGSLLQPDRLGPDGITEPPPVAALLAEERRLFYVATTRARRRLVVTAVDSPEDDGVRPSRFLGELGVAPQAVGGRPQRPLTLPALVAELRSVAADPGRPAALRAAAARRLAALASATEGGVALVPSAHPDRWWGVAESTEAAVELFPAGRPIPLSGSSLSSLTDCPLRWFLDHEVHASDARSTALGFGSIVHAVAHHVANGGPTDLGQLMALVEPVWDQLAFEARWLSDAERERARDVVARLLAWHGAPRDRTLVAAEQEFVVQLTVGGRPVVLRGSMDRVEVDADGFVHVVDFKTSKNMPTKAQVAEHVQLGVYLKVVAEGALRDAGLAEGEAAGAELIMLKHGLPDGQPKVAVQPAGEPDADGALPIDQVIATAVRRLADEDFPPVPNQWCGFCQFRAVCPTLDEGRQVVR